MSVSCRAWGHPQLVRESLTRAQLCQPCLHPGLYWEGRRRKYHRWVWDEDPTLPFSRPGWPTLHPGESCYHLSNMCALSGAQRPDYSNNCPSLVTCPVWKTAPSCCTKRGFSGFLQCRALISQPRTRAGCAPCVGPLRSVNTTPERNTH